MHGGLEVRSTREANTTMLGKHIWTILKDTTKPRVQVVNAKYLHGESILRSRQFPGASCTWMSLMEAAESLEPGFKFRVGQEHQAIYFRWIEGIYILTCESDSKTTLSFVTTGVVDIHPFFPVVQKIRSFIEGNNCADWLAKKGASEDQQMVIVNVCPASLKSKVLADALGVFFTRSS
ncbi:hypothetical protein GmHk_20G057943 [Glycine max]|nr:hypothetical protein GmHk_20G057943 [Glycine max]